MSTFIPVPAALLKFFSTFPLHTFPPVPLPSAARNVQPTLWIQPPIDKSQPAGDLLSGDVECLKWQAYIALRGVTNVCVRWDISPAGGLDGRLPCLQKSDSSKEVLGARMIPGWVDGVLEKGDGGPFEGYRDEAAKDESRAWVSLLEGAVHAALVLSRPTPSIASPFISFSSFDSTKSSFSTLLTPPPAPLSGIWSLLTPYGESISPSTIDIQYRDAIASLSERLGADQWFLGSSGPTALDALVFAYLHTLMDTPHDIRIAVSKRVNLVSWEARVRVIVQSAFLTTHSN